MTQSGRQVILGAVLLCAGLGTVHGFSVFLRPFEDVLGVGRATVVLTYSFTLVAITTMVLLGPRVYGLLRPSVLVAVSAGMAAIGVVLAGLSHNLVGLWGGYSVIFGAANGLGYGFTLQYAEQAAPGREGIAMGIVTAYCNVNP